MSTHGSGRTAQVDSGGTLTGNTKTNASSLSAKAAGTESFDPKKYAGQTVRILLVDRERDDLGVRDVQTGEFGGDTLYLLPGIESGSCILFYRKDLLGGIGQPAVPTTCAEYLAAAKALTSGDVAGSAMVGANDMSNFLVDWYARFITMSGQLTSGSKKNKTLTARFDSPEAVAALQNMIDLLP